MANLSVFQFQAEKSVRVETKNGEPWFCLKDVAEILEIRDTKAKNFNLKEAGVEKIPLRSGGQNRELTFINEPNLYRVIFRSNKAEALKFQDWIFEEVLPAIRQTGGYRVSSGHTIHSAQQRQLREAVMRRHRRTGENWQDIYYRLHRFCRVGSIREIAAADFQAALDFLNSIENAPAPCRAAAVAIDNETLISIARLLVHARNMRRFVLRYLAAFENMGLDHAAALHGFAHDAGADCETVRRFYLEHVERLAESPHKAANAWLHLQLARPL